MYNIVSIWTGIETIDRYLFKNYISKFWQKNTKIENTRYIYNTSMIHLYLKYHNKNMKSLTIYFFVDKYNKSIYRKLSTI